MEGRRLLCLFLVMFCVAAATYHPVHGDDARVPDIGLVSASKAYQESRRPPEVNSWGRKLRVENNNAIAEQRMRRRRISHDEEWNNNDFVAFNADYKAPRHHPPKNN